MPLYTKKKHVRGIDKIQKKYSNYINYSRLFGARRLYALVQDAYTIGKVQAVQHS